MTRIQLKDPTAPRGLSMKQSTWSRIDALAIERGIPVSRLIEQIVLRSFVESDRLVGRTS